MIDQLGGEKKMPMWEWNLGLPQFKNVNKITNTRFSLSGEETRMKPELLSVNHRTNPALVYKELSGVGNKLFDFQIWRLQ